MTKMPATVSTFVQMLLGHRPGPEQTGDELTTDTALNEFSGKLARLVPGFDEQVPHADLSDQNLPGADQPLPDVLVRDPNALTTATAKRGPVHQVHQQINSIGAALTDVKNAKLPATAIGTATATSPAGRAQPAIVAKPDGSAEPDAQLAHQLAAHKHRSPGSNVPGVPGELPARAMTTPTVATASAKQSIQAASGEKSGAQRLKPPTVGQSSEGLTQHSAQSGAQVDPLRGPALTGNARVTRDQQAAVNAKRGTQPALVNRPRAQKTVKPDAQIAIAQRQQSPSNVARATLQQKSPAALSRQVVNAPSHSPEPATIASRGKTSSLQATDLRGTAQPGTGEVTKTHGGTSALVVTPVVGVSESSATAGTLAKSFEAGVETIAESAMSIDELSIETPLGEEGFKSDLSRQVISAIRRGVEQIRIRVHPEELGPIQVELTVDGQQASVSFSALHAETREAIRSSLNELRNGFDETGIELIDASVSDEPEEKTGDDDRQDESRPVLRDDAKPMQTDGPDATPLISRPGAAGATTTVDLFV